jgi:hypothetical protein
MQQLSVKETEEAVTDIRDRPQSYDFIIGGVDNFSLQ